MSSTRRVVRATPRFFEDLDRQLGYERGPNGELSTNDFQVFELIRIVDRFAVGFDMLPRLIDERDDYRVLVGRNTRAGAFGHRPAGIGRRRRTRAARHRSRAGLVALRTLTIADHPRIHPTSWAIRGGIQQHQMEGRSE